jgi:hypothetical protein
MQRYATTMQSRLRERTNVERTIRPLARLSNDMFVRCVEMSPGVSIIHGIHGDGTTIVAMGVKMGNAEFTG